MTEEEEPAHPSPLSIEQMLLMYRQMVSTAPTEEMRLEITKKIEELEKKIANNG